MRASSPALRRRPRRTSSEHLDAPVDRARSHARARRGSTTRRIAVRDGREEFLAPFWRPETADSALYSQILSSRVGYGNRRSEVRILSGALRVVRGIARGSGRSQGRRWLRRRSAGDNRGDNGGRRIGSGAAATNLDARRLRARLTVGGRLCRGRPAAQAVGAHVSRGARDQAPRDREGGRAACRAHAAQLRPGVGRSLCRSRCA
jgi:hypothetical protein